MDIEEQQRRTIAEQRAQLMQLREQLKSLKGQTPNQSQPNVKGLLDQFYPRPTGTTIGIQIPPAMRARLMSQLEVRRRSGAKNYGHVILVCIELGLQMLERSTDAEHPVEAVQDVLGPDDSRNGADTVAS